jgi:hypothetical protein
MARNKILTSKNIDKPVGRTFLLYLLIFGYLVLAWFGSVRCYAVFDYKSLLNSYLSQGMLAYIAIGGAIWALAGLAAAVTLWIGSTSATRLSRCAALACFLWYWFDYLFMSQSSLSKTNWLFSLIATLLALSMAWWVPILPKERKFLHRKLKQEP